MYDYCIQLVYIIEQAHIPTNQEQTRKRKEEQRQRQRQSLSADMAATVTLQSYTP